MPHKILYKQFPERDFNQGLRVRGKTGMGGYRVWCWNWQFKRVLSKQYIKLSSCFSGWMMYPHYKDQPVNVFGEIVPVYCVYYTKQTQPVWKTLLMLQHVVHIVTSHCVLKYSQKGVFFIISQAEQYYLGLLYCNLNCPPYAHFAGSWMACCVMLYLKYRKEGSS